MKFQFKPFVVFNAGTDTGVDKIPLNSYVQIHNDGSGNSRLIYVKALTGMTGVSTVADLVAATANYDSVLLNESADNLPALDLVNDATPVLGGNLDANNKILNDVVLKGKSNTINDVGSVSTNTTIDFSTNKVQKVTVTADVQLDFTVNSSKSQGWYIDDSIELDSIGISSILANTQFIAFSTDGTKFYEGDYDTNNINTRVLSTPWDITTASASQSSDASGVSGLVGGHFKPDGTKLYLLQFSNDTLVEYNLTTPWDISSKSLVTSGISMANGFVGGVYFKPDGTKVYESGSSPSRIYQHTLSTPWAISSISLDTVGIAPSGDGITDIDFNPDGTILYELAYTTKKVFSHKLSTPWDITSITYDTIGKSFVDNNPRAFAFSSDGYYMYESAANLDKIYQHKIGSSTKEELTLFLHGADANTVTFADNIIWDTETPFFNTDLTILKFVTYDNGIAYYGKVEFGSYIGAWDLSTAFYDNKVYQTSTQSPLPKAVFFKPNGDSMYVLDETNTTVYQYTLSTPWDVTSATYASKSAAVGTQEGQPWCLSFSSDGTKMYVLGNINEDVFQYTLSTAWDVSTATYASISYDLSTRDSSGRGLYFREDGLKMYYLGTSNDSVYQYTLGTAWNVSTATYDSKSYSVANVLHTGLFFSSDGLNMYLTDWDNNSVDQYVLSTAWDVSTASTTTKSIDTTAVTTTPYSPFFRSDGKKLYIVNSSDRIHQYSVGK